MPLTATSLSAAITAGQLTFGVTSTASGFPVVGTQNANQPILIDSELMWLVGVPVANVITVRMRGSDGTAAVAHDVLANVYTSATVSDFGTFTPASPTLIDPASDTVQSIGQDGNIPLPGGPGSNIVYNINKATAAALTLAAPALSLNGMTVYLTSQTAAAHVITATSLLMDGTAAAPKSTLTFTAGKGASVLLIAENGFWSIQATQNVAVA